MPDRNTDQGGNQLPLLPRRRRTGRVDPQLISRLMAALRGRGWVRRRELRLALGISDDALRALARYSNGEIIGSSAHGYALTREAPVADVNHVIAEMLSRSKQLRARVAEVLEVLNGRPHDALSGAGRVPAVGTAWSSSCPSRERAS